jgi:hypothetical protein
MPPGWSLREMVARIGEKTDATEAGLQPHPAALFFLPLCMPKCWQAKTTVRERSDAPRWRSRWCYIVG